MSHPFGNSDDTPSKRLRKAVYATFGSKASNSSIATSIQLQDGKGYASYQLHGDRRDHVSFERQVPFALPGAQIYCDVETQEILTERSEKTDGYAKIKSWLEEYDASTRKNGKGTSWLSLTLIVSFPIFVMNKDNPYPIPLIPYLQLGKKYKSNPEEAWAELRADLSQKDRDYLDNPTDQQTGKKIEGPMQRGLQGFIAYWKQHAYWKWMHKWCCSPKNPIHKSIFKDLLNWVNTRLLPEGLFVPNLVSCLRHDCGEAGFGMYDIAITPIRIVKLKNGKTVHNVAVTSALKELNNKVKERTTFAAIHTDLANYLAPKYGVTRGKRRELSPALKNDVETTRKVRTELAVTNSENASAKILLHNSLKAEKQLRHHLNQLSQEKTKLLEDREGLSKGLADLKTTIKIQTELKEEQKKDINNNKARIHGQKELWDKNKDILQRQDERLQKKKQIIAEHNSEIVCLETKKKEEASAFEFMKDGVRHCLRLLEPLRKRILELRQKGKELNSNIEELTSKEETLSKEVAILKDKFAQESNKMEMAYAANRNLSKDASKLEALIQKQNNTIQKNSEIIDNQVSMIDEHKANITRLKEEIPKLPDHVRQLLQESAQLNERIQKQRAEVKQIAREKDDLSSGIATLRLEHTTAQGMSREAKKKSFADQKEAEERSRVAKEKSDEQIYLSERRSRIAKEKSDEQIRLTHEEYLVAQKELDEIKLRAKAMGIALEELESKVEKKLNRGPKMGF